MKKLTGNQSKLDLNKNGKLDAEDFKMLRGNKMAKGSTVKGADYYEQLAVYVQGVGSIYNGTSMVSATKKANDYLKKHPKAEVVISDEKYGDTYDLNGNIIEEYAKAISGQGVLLKDYTKNYLHNKSTKKKQLQLKSLLRRAC
jgi:hypothetical protein